jgi:malonate decarboxylase delta subunit
MEHLEFDFPGRPMPVPARAQVIVGVVSSGNLEVLMEKVSLNGSCHVNVDTVITGFGRIWQAVLSDFFARHALSDVRISINDVGATPAVVGLRLVQALEDLQRGVS